MEHASEYDARNFVGFIRKLSGVFKLLLCGYRPHVGVNKRRCVEVNLFGLFAERIDIL